jgi:hypothetical protein
MPAEWEPHESTWLAWPHFRGDWPGKFEPIPWVYAEIVRNLARHERVDLIVNNASSENGARAMLEKADALSDNVCFHRWRTDRVWTRDSGCIFLTPAASIILRRLRAARSALSIQRLGKVSELQVRRKGWRAHGQSRWRAHRAAVRR